MMKYVGSSLWQPADIDKVYSGETYIDKYGYEWRPVKDTELILSYVGFDRGRSSVTFWWKDPAGNQYPMFLKDVDDLLKKSCGASCIHGIFTFVKRGMGYGIKLVKLID